MIFSARILFYRFNLCLFLTFFFFQLYYNMKYYSLCYNSKNTYNLKFITFNTSQKKSYFKYFYSSKEYQDEKSSRCV